MEATNELITASEASAEGLNITSSNECITKQEFVDNLPRGGREIHLTGMNTYQYTLVINNSSRDLTGIVVYRDGDSIDFTFNKQDVYSFSSVYDLYFTNTADSLCYDSKYCYGEMSNDMTSVSEQSVNINEAESINSGYDSSYLTQIIIIKDR